MVEEQATRESAGLLRPVFVLGMHRSGTSCLAGCLEDMGLRFGNVNRAAKYNRKGNMEDAEVYGLNDAVLAATGNAWDNPPAGEAQWTNETRRRRDSIIERYRAAGEQFGWKDPRFILTFDGWLERIAAPQIIATVRKPAAVAVSLVNRGGITFVQGLELWAAYNSRLLQIARRQELKGRFISFDEPEERYLAQVKRLGAEVGLNASGARLSFFEKDLRQSQATELPQVPDQYDRLHQQLLEFI